MQWIIHQKNNTDRFVGIFRRYNINFLNLVSRLVCTSDNFEMELQLDINSEIYKLKLNQKVSFNSLPIDQQIAIDIGSDAIT